MKKYILLREDFENLDTAENLKDKNDIISISNDINDYKKYKKKIEDIFLNSETQEDITKALKGINIMDKDGKVNNGLISVHISYASKLRQITKIENELKEIDSSISNLGSGEQTELSDAAIKGKEENKKELMLRLREIETDLRNITKKNQEKLKEYEKKIKELKNIRY